MQEIAKQTTFDFTPDPKVLIALANTNMAPLDALCELIDNAIDSFSYANADDVHIPHPVVWVEIPKKSDVEAGVGLLRVRDNGPGMTAEIAEKAIKAGYSGNNSYDTLGLFGMGFNISTSKFGRVTKFYTARPVDDFYTYTIIDLEKINNSKSYALDALSVPKNENFTQGTIVEVSDWWPEGSANANFIKKLINYGNNRILNELGRRYATILRNGMINIVVNGKPCVPYEHCVWSKKRSVNRGKNIIPARYDIDEIVGVKRRCSSCRAIVDENAIICPACKSSNIRTAEERVYGWVGIQRFDDATNFGIDLIRNGRAIRIAEKAAFFEYTDEFKNTIKDYPIDGPYGRIVGEVHLDFVPVDYTKQDFQRSSEEWTKAMRLLRGASSLQPRQPGADKNESYIFKLYQGYRRVREYGTTDMYMGYWDPAENKSKRIGREVEKEYYQKFLEKIPGYYDDEKWWEKVEEASKPPVELIEICPNCKTQILKELNKCPRCGIELEKTKKSDAITIIKEIMPGKNFITTDDKQQKLWTCLVCGAQNISTQSVCLVCNKRKGEKNNLTNGTFVDKALLQAEYSLKRVEITLADGTKCIPFDVETFFTNEPMFSPVNKARIPSTSIRTISLYKLFIDPTHPVFLEHNTTVEDFIVMEIASFIYSMTTRLISHPGHTITSIAWEIQCKYFNSDKNSYEQIKDNSQVLVKDIGKLLYNSIESSIYCAIYDKMTLDEQKELQILMYKHGIATEKTSELRDSGQFLIYLSVDLLVKIFEENPLLFFNGNVWNDSFGTNTFISQKNILSIEDEMVRCNYQNALETVRIFLNFQYRDIRTLIRVKDAVMFLRSNMREE